jgi:hypothetical protein
MCDGNSDEYPYQSTSVTSLRLVASSMNPLRALYRNPHNIRPATSPVQEFSCLTLPEPIPNRSRRRTSQLPKRPLKLLGMLLTPTVLSLF